MHSYTPSVDNSRYIRNNRNNRNKLLYFINLRHNSLGIEILCIFDRTPVDTGREVVVVSTPIFVYII